MALGTLLVFASTADEAKTLVRKCLYGTKRTSASIGITTLEIDCKLDCFAPATYETKCFDVFITESGELIEKDSLYWLGIATAQDSLFDLLYAAYLHKAVEQQLGVAVFMYHV